MRIVILVQFHFQDIWADSINAYKLVEGSAGIDEGTDLSAYFTTDINGVTRPVGAGWNLGAVEDILVILSKLRILCS